VLRRVFGPKRDEVTGGWRKLHNELHNLYPSPSIIRMIKSLRMKLTGHVARMRERRNAYRILVGKPEVKSPLDQDVGGLIILKWILERQDGGGMDWTDLALDRGQWRVLVNMVMNLRVP
jgi:hypothetical protein